MIMKYRNDGASFCLSLFHAWFLENLCRDKVFKQKYQTVLQSTWGLDIFCRLHPRFFSDAHGARTMVNCGQFVNSCVSSKINGFLNSSFQSSVSTEYRV